MLLARLGGECRSASTGYDSLRVAHEFSPNVIFLDLGLPDVSGYDVARMLRARGSSAYIVAVSGWGREQDVQHALDAGFDQHIHKPARRAQLASAVAAARSVRRI